MAVQNSKNDGLNFAFNRLTSDVKEEQNPVCLYENQPIRVFFPCKPTWKLIESEDNGWVKTKNLIHQYILVGLLLCKKDSFPINFVLFILQKKKKLFCCRKRNRWRKKWFNTGSWQYFRQKWWTIFFIYKQNFKAIILWVLG